MPKRLPEVLTNEECLALLKQPNPKAPTGLRNLCMLTVMLNLGLRASEVLHLRVNDIDWMSGKLMVRNGKGGKDRALCLNEDDLDLLRSWRERRPASAEFLFSTLKGKPLHDRYLRAMVGRLAERAGIDRDEAGNKKKKFHPHALRHTFATSLYRETKNIRLVQKALGHSFLSTTAIYMHLVDDELESALRGFRCVKPAA